ncbi:MAG: endonuclease domain-containing protein [Alicyclobacillus sp.]|nr:endonuclease domain-containing protein [Alicyclobacillus sp.]
MRVPTDAKAAWDEMMRVFDSIESARKKKSKKSMEQQIELWMQHRMFSVFADIRLAFNQTKSPIEAIAYLYLLHWEPCWGPADADRPKIYPQHRIGRYTADFLVTWGQYKFVIECDGHDFHEKTKEQAAHDKKRDREMTSMGYIVMRFTGSEIWNDPYVLERALDDYLYQESLREG